MNLARRLAVVLAALLVGARIGTAAPALTLHPCDVPGVAGGARCGTFPVPENRSAHGGRKIDLNVVVLPATGSSRAADALTFLEGGPGGSAVESAPGLARELAAIQEHREILLVDQRGTGKSNSLACSSFGPDLPSYLREFLPLESARRCLARVTGIADPTQYATPNAADDLDEVRAALGYDRLNLFGVSYGTRAALVYLRRHSEHVRAVILHGVSPTDQTMPLHFARDTQRALEGILDECAAEEACRRAFPEGKRELRDVVARLAADAVEVEVLNPETSAPAKVRLSRDLAAETLRYLAYSSGGARWIPAFVHAAAGGDLRPIAEMGVFFRRDLVDSGSLGVYLSVTCAEDLPWADPREAAREAEGTALGDYREREQLAACGLWPRATLPPGYRSPVRSDKPVLLFSGALDPVTPPANGAAVARTLSRSLHVVVPHGGHSFDGLEGIDCVSRLRTDFIERGTVEGLDTKCVADLRRPPFPTELPPLAPIASDEAALSRLAGSFRSADGAGTVRVEVADGHAMLSMEGEPPRRLVAVSPTRWRMAGGYPFGYAIFDPAGDAPRLVLEFDGHAEGTFVRETGASKP